MADRLKLSDPALDACAAACALASQSFVNTLTAEAPVLGGVTDVGVRLAEFMAALGVACKTLAGAADAAAANALVCKQGSTLVDVGLASGVTAGAGAGGVQ